MWILTGANAKKQIKGAGNFFRRTAFQRKWGWSWERLRELSERDGGLTLTEGERERREGVLDPCAILREVCQGCQDSGVPCHLGTREP